MDHHHSPRTISKKPKSYNAFSTQNTIKAQASRIKSESKEIEKEREREIHQKYSLKWFFETSNGRFEGSRDREEEGSRARAGFVFLLAKISFLPSTLWFTPTKVNAFISAVEMHFYEHPPHLTATMHFIASNTVTLQPEPLIYGKVKIDKEWWGPICN